MAVAKKYAWIFDLQNLVGVIVGIIMVSIGLAMVINSVAKVYVLGYESNSYFNAEDQCMYKNIPYQITDKAEGSQDTKLTEQEKQDCITKKTAQEKKRYVRDKMENIIDGGILLLIGLPLWFFHRRRGN